MIGCIVTGHGEFSIGLLKAFEMIAGPQEKMIAVPFNEAEPLTSYQENLKLKSEEFLADGEPLIVLTDLMGGTPFNTAMLLKQEHKNMHVLAGTNLPMLLEVMVQRMGDSPIDAVLEKIIDTGSKGVVIGEIKRSETQEEDGI